MAKAYHQGLYRKRIDADKELTTVVNKILGRTDSNKPIAVALRLQ